MRTLLNKEDPILRQMAEQIPDSEFGSPWLQTLITDMIEIMKDKGAVGVAAPQIGINKRVIVFGTAYTKSRKISDPIADTVLINPSLNILSDDLQTDYEGCLNSDDLRGRVPRAMEIEYCGYDFLGKCITKQVSGLEGELPVRPV